MNLQKLQAQLTAQEGKRNRPYRDSKGNWTIGIGHNLSAKPISEAAVQQIFRDDVTDAIIATAEYFPWLQALNDDVRVRVYVNLVFNMGPHAVLEFREMNRAAQRGDWERAAAELLDSKYATDVGDGPGGRFDRAEVLAYMLRTGKDYEAEKV